MVELIESENTERVALQMKMLLCLLVVFAKHLPFLNLQIIDKIPQKQFKCRFMNFCRSLSVFKKKNKKMLRGKHHYIWGLSPPIGIFSDPKIDETGTYYGFRLRQE